MAEGVCSRTRAKVVIVALIVLSVVAASIAVIVYFSTRNDGSSKAVSPENGPQPIFRLPSTIQPMHYELEFRPDFYKSNASKFELAGEVVIRVRCKEVTSVIILHAIGLNISRDRMEVAPVQGNGTSMPSVESWELDEEKETLSLKLDSSLEKGQLYDIHFAFQAPLTARFRAVYYSTYKENNQTKYFVSTIFVVTNARRAFPCFDEPALKAEFTLTVLRKAAFIALSNMPIDNSTRRTVNGEEWVVDRFQKSPKMSTYLLTFTVCQFQSRSANTSRGYTIKAWSRPESEQQTAFALEVGTRVMPFFDKYFGIKFPLPEQGMIALPEFRYRGMEHWGLISYKERTLLYSDALPSSLDRQRIATIIVHELGHTWFGNLLTMAWWDDAWLNEGFASYVQYLGMDLAFPKWKVLEQFLTLTFRKAMNIDAFEQSRPLYKAVIYPGEPLAAFDRVIYYKGASVLRMVKFFLGESTFKRGIQKYLDKFKYATATHEDMWSSLNTEAERDQNKVNVSDVMRGWTLQKNFPVVMVTRNSRGIMTVTQQRFLLKGDSSDESYRWDIPFTFATSSTHNPDQDMLPSDVIWLFRHQKEFTITNQSIPGPDDKGQWVLGNIGCHGYYRVHYEKNNWLALIKQLKMDHRRISLANRAQIIMDSWGLAKAGLLDYTVALETLGYLQNETQYVPWKAALIELQELKYILIANQSVYQQFSTFMQRKTDSIFDSFDPNATLLEELRNRTPIMVAKAACTYGLPACVAMARTQFVQWMSQPVANTINVDLRSTFYCTALAYGNRSEWDFVFNQFRQESTANERSRLRMALACSLDLDILNTLINRTLDPVYIREQDAVDTLIACANNINGRPLVWRFVRDHFPVIYERFGDTAFILKKLFSGISQSFYTQAELQELEELAEKYPEAASSMTDTIEKTRANIEWVKTNMASVEHWFRQQNAPANAGV